MKESIITCTYNSAATIADTIRSVNAQTYPNIEHIIVDGLSKDNTLEIVKQYARERQIIKSEKDNGIYDAFNKGIRMATGDIIGVLNSDDFFTSNNIIEQVVNAFDKENIDAVYGDIHFVNSDNLNKCVRYYSSKSFRPWMMRMGFMFAHPSFYVKREYYENLGLYKTDYKIAADFELLLRFVVKNKINCKYLPLDFVTMRTGGASTEGVKSKNIINKECLRACKENNYYSSIILMWLRIVYKAFELILFKLKLKYS